MGTTIKTISLYILLSIIVITHANYLIYKFTGINNLNFNYSELISFTTFTIFLITIFIFRRIHSADSLESHHAVFVKRTFWIWVLFSIIGTIAMLALLVLRADNSMLTNINSSIKSGGSLSTTEITSLNTALIKSAIITLVPPQIYVVYRIIKGTIRAIMGYRINNLRNWF